MIKILILILFCGIILFLCHKLCLWLERQGLLYYRDKKSSSAVIGETLQELNAILQPSARHVMEAKQNKAQFKLSSNDDSNKKI